MRMATVGRARVLTWLPVSLMAWPHQSFRNSPSRHSLGWNTGIYDGAHAEPGFLDFRRQLRVLLFADQVIELTAIFEPHLDEPSRAIRFGVDEVRVVQHLRVDLHHLAAHRRLQRRGRVV